MKNLSLLRYFSAAAEKCDDPVCQVFKFLKIPLNLDISFREGLDNSFSRQQLFRIT
ncbi:hypothetical protein [Cognataquiflexum aquatile]|uniref:hypothetical protein n=1 Tax=Cognataquiflexum aquatile TaxID=2249427 RepID=UPI0013009790|nr:hypothetical protein [Cognataquiflexum aquatile]